MRMTRLMAAALASAALPGALALSATPVIAAPSANDTFIGEILANPADAATINRRCDQYVAEIERLQGLLERETGRATIDGTLQRYDDINQLVSAGGSEFALYREVMADEARRAAGSACEVRLDALSSKL